MPYQFTGHVINIRFEYDMPLTRKSGRFLRLAQYDTKYIGAIRKSQCASTETRTFRYDFRPAREALTHRGNDCRARRRHRFCLDASAVGGDTAQTFNSGGCRQRNHAVTTMDKPVSERQRRGAYFSLQMNESSGRTDHVNDGVNGTHLVKMDAVNWDIVNARFSLGQPLKNARRQFTHFRR